MVKRLAVNDAERCVGCQSCMFACAIYTEEAAVKALGCTGFEMSPEALKHSGEDTLRRKNAFKRREGFDFGDLYIPERILKTLSPLGQVDAGFLRQAIARFAENVQAVES